METQILALMSQIRTATLAARQRTGDKCISTQAQGGQLRVVRTVPIIGKRTSAVIPLSEMLPIPDAIKVLDALQ